MSINFCVVYNFFHQHSIILLFFKFPHLNLFLPFAGGRVLFLMLLFCLFVFPSAGDRSQGLTHARHLLYHYLLLTLLLLLGGDIVNGITFFKKSTSLLVMYKTATVFCIQILYPAYFLNLHINSKDFVLFCGFFRTFFI